MFKRETLPEERLTREAGPNRLKGWGVDTSVRATASSLEGKPDMSIDNRPKHIVITGPTAVLDGQVR